MIYDWFKLFNEDDFLATGLPSRTITRILDGVGLKDILVTVGDFTGITYDGVFLCVGMNDKNPFEFELHAVYIDDNGDVWLGINGRES